MRLTVRALLPVAAILLAPSVRGDVECSRVAADVSALPKEMRLVADLLATRVAERTPVSDAANTLRVRYALDAGVSGEDARVTVKDGAAEIRAAGVRGLVYGTGRLLKALRYGRTAFRVPDGAFDFRPAKGFRMAYLAMHFLNGFMDTPTDEMLRYIDDLALDGVNRFTFAPEMNVVDVAEGTDADKAAYAARARAMVARLTALGCGYFTGCASNQLPTDTDESLRAEPNDNPKAPSTGFNACPAKPAAHAMILERRRKSLERLSGTDVRGFYYWPYDEGGCGCAACRPWGANGFLRLSEEMAAMNRAAFPDAQSIVSTWFFTDEEYAGLWSYLKTHDWIDYLIVDDFGPEYPKYPLEHPVPGRTRIITFPEISMWGRRPWGGYGATALPKFLERLFRQCESVVDGFDYYAEGLYEDVNKWIVTSLYVDPTRTADGILAEYGAYHFAGCDPKHYVELANLLETNHRPPLMRRENVLRALELSDRIDREMLPSLRASWRWRLTRLRTLVDAEIVRTGELSPSGAIPYFDEIVKISHCERQARRIWDGRDGGWTCPCYFPRERVKVLTPPAGDASELLRAMVSDRTIHRIWLGRGVWRVGGLSIVRPRLTLTLTDGAVLVSGKGALSLGPGARDITIAGEGTARIDMPVVLDGVTNAVVKGVSIRGDDVRLARSSGIVAELPARRIEIPADDPTGDVQRLDAAAEWAEQHLEFEKADRLASAIRKLQVETQRERIRVK